MDIDFNFYDFVSYIIPGTFLFGLLYWFLKGFCALELTIEINSIGESVLFIVASYSLGHLVQVVGNVIEERQKEKWGGWFSEQLLRPDNKHYSMEFKAHIKKFIREIFELSPDISPGGEEISKKRRQEVFGLCYSFIVQEKIASHTEIFNGIYGLFKGFLSVVWIGIPLSVLIISKHLLWFVLSLKNVSLPEGLFWQYDLLQVKIGVPLLVVSILLIHPMECRFKYFAEKFADSVYRTFYVWCEKERFKKKSGTQIPNYNSAEMKRKEEKSRDI
jgi:hypothetical protein